MTALLELDDADLTGYATRTAAAGAATPVNTHLTGLSIEDAQVALKLVALLDDDVLDEVQLMLAVRLQVDDVVHLWSTDDEPLAATVVLEPASHHMRLTLRFQPTGRSARQASRTATFLQAAGQATHLALRLPDGQLAPDRLQVPPELGLEAGLVRLLDLLAEVSQLSGVDLPVPEHVDDELLKDLLVARRLLSGQVVRGTWATGELRLEHADLDTVRAALEQAEQHDLLHVAPLDLNVHGTRVPLGPVQQQFTHAVVDHLAAEHDDVVLRLRAYAPTTAQLR